MNRDDKGRFIKGSNVGVSNPRWSGGKQDIPCTQCGKVKDRYVTRKNQKNYFCNTKCKGLWQSKNLVGENNMRWKGGFIYENGYKMLNMPDHHRAHQNGYVYEHIVVAEKKFNKKILRPMQIHHLNGVRDDNRPDNLDIVTPQEHEKWTVKKIYEKRIRELEAQLTSSDSPD